MAELIEAPYGEVMLAALLPILLYYVALFLQVDLAAAKHGLVAVPRDRIPPIWPTLRSGWHFILPFVVFLAGVFSFGMQPENAALWALGTLLASALLLGYQGRRARPSDLLGALTGGRARGGRGHHGDRRRRHRDRRPQPVRLRLCAEPDPDHLRRRERGGPAAARGAGEPWAWACRPSACTCCSPPW
jgi:Tripartite ATP-independent periplasmic transporter, DctM component